jgi:hypothetical protein
MKKICSSILLLILSFTLASCGGGAAGGARQAADEFLGLLKEGKYEEAQKYLSTEAQKEYDVEKLKQIKLPENMVMQENPEISKNDGKIMYGDENTKRYVQLVLLKEGKEWKISKVQSFILSY